MTQKKTVTYLTLKIGTSDYYFSSKFLHLKQVKNIGSLLNGILGLHQKTFLGYNTCKWAYKITTFDERKPGTREFGRFRSIV